MRLNAVARARLAFHRLFVLEFAATGFRPAAAAVHLAEATMELTEWDSGHAVELRLGERLAVSLEGNPTLGYRWEVEANDPALLQPNGTPQFTAAGGVPGGGGRFTLKFTAISAGQTDLRLRYRRTFDKVAPPAKRFQVSVTVR
jgi:inhibitor of cysteine peptidase